MTVGMRMFTVAVAVVLGLPACGSDAPAAADAFSSTTVDASPVAVDGPAPTDAGPPSADAALPMFPDAGPVASDAGAPGDQSAQFVGMWMWAPGRFQLTCPAFAPYSEILTGTVLVARGIDAPLVLPVNGGSCLLRLDPAGNAATLRPGQVCPPITGTLGDGTPFTETDTFQSGNLVVNGPVATMSLSSSINVVSAGQTMICASSTAGTLHKISP